MKPNSSETKFIIGQRVVCVDSSTYNVNLPFELDIKKTYIIEDIKNCSCGETLLILKKKINSDTTFYCAICGKEMPCGEAYLSFRFKHSHLNIVRC